MTTFYYATKLGHLLSRLCHIYGRLWAQIDDDTDAPLPSFSDLLKRSLVYGRRAFPAKKIWFWTWFVNFWNLLNWQVTRALVYTYMSPSIYASSISEEALDSELEMETAYWHCLIELCTNQIVNWLSYLISGAWCYQFQLIWIWFCPLF